jgi:hypothetical protein
MYVLITLFASSLFLIALFFAIKEREVYSGSEIWLTRFLRRHSPAVQAFAGRMGAGSLSHVRSVFARLEHWYTQVVHYILWAARALIVMLAERMIHAVKGEKLLSMRNVSSMYLKHLKEHKDNTAGGAPQV